MKKSKILVLFLVIGLLGILIFRAISLPLAILVVGGVSGWFIYQYNNLQKISQEIQESHSNIQIAMKKRLDLAGKLMEIAANYTDHESMTQLGVAKLEALPENNASTGMAPSYGMFGSFMTMSRDYPELQANQTYQTLMGQLEDIENGLQNRRETYNVKVRSYNTGIATIPMVFLADRLGFQTAPYFDAIADDEIGSLGAFRTADGTQLKAFLSGLKNQVIHESKQLTNGLMDTPTRDLGHEENGRAELSSLPSDETENQHRKD